MSASILQNPIFTDNDKAREWLEARVWAHGRPCPHCGVVDHSTLLRGKAHRQGLYQCGECREQFTVTVGTVFERSKIPLSKWLAALFLMVSSKKGVSAHQVHRLLGISYKSTWFMMHRLREAMRVGGLAPMGGKGSIIEADETFIGRRKGVEAKPGWVKHKHTVLTLVERGGSARSFHIDEATKENIIPIVHANLDRESHLMTDEARRYESIGKEFSAHSVVDHSREEYGYTDRLTGAKVNTNTVEGYYSIFKRGMKGVYQHCSEKHLHRYLAEFDFRYSNRSALGIEDRERADILAGGIVGKRLTYRRPVEADKLRG
jgi:transposase-like protein